MSGRNAVKAVGRAISDADVTDSTKKIALNLSNISTATTRTLTVPDADVTISSFSTTILDDADAASARTTLELDATYLRIISNPVKNMLQRGMVASGSSADAAANTAVMNEAIAELTGAYGGIYIPLGTYYLDATLNAITDTSARIKGDGRGISRLVFTGTNPQGFKFNLSSLGYAVGVEDISILVDSASSNHGLWFERPDSLSSDGYFGPIVKNVEIGGINLTSGFVNGLRMNNCWGASVIDFAERGRPGTGFADLNGSSIVLDGNSTGVVMQRIRSLHRDNGVFSIVGSFSEGPQLQFSEFVNCNYGVYLNSATGAPEGASPPYADISSCHFAINKTGVVSFFRPQLDIHDNSFYNRLVGFGDTVNAANWIAVYLNNGNQSIVHDNIALGFGYGSFFVGDTCVRTAVYENTVEDTASGFNCNDNCLVDVARNRLNSVTTEYAGMTGSISGVNTIW